VRLADTSLADAEREATWWTLVEAIDTYLRLLHPVMPFVTEALWDVLPRAAGEPELLIVARWPSAERLASWQDAGLDEEVRQVLELIGAVRTARATRGVPASAWLPVSLGAPGGLRPTIDALRPAIERLARARPLSLAEDHDGFGAAAPGELVVVAGPLEARVVTSEAAGAKPSQPDRARLEQDLAQAEAALTATRARLEDPAFVERAPAAIVLGARTRERELADRVARLRESVR
jgi:valyl-tRNA synthetase